MSEIKKELREGEIEHTRQGNSRNQPRAGERGDTNENNIQYIDMR